MTMNLDNLLDFDLPTRDFGREISKDLPNGNAITMKQAGPYGFWTLHLRRGQLPAKFTGSYTSISEAERAIEEYSRLKTKE